MFPFIIKYERPLPPELESVDNETILKSIEEKLVMREVDEVSFESSSVLKFNIELWPRFSWDIWQGLSGGTFEINETANHRSVIYRFNTTRSFVAGLVLAIALSFGLKSISFGLLGLTSAIFYWLVSLGRHWMFFKELLADARLKLKEKKAKVNSDL